MNNRYHLIPRLLAPYHENKRNKLSWILGFKIYPFCGAMTLSIMTSNIMILSKKGLHVTFSINSTQNKRHPAFQCSAIMLSVNMLSVTMLSVTMLSVIMLSVIMLSVIMLSVIMLSIIMLSVKLSWVLVLFIVILSVIMLICIMMSVIMLSVVAHFLNLDHEKCMEHLHEMIVRLSH
jgi:hypothetical protein